MKKVLIVSYYYPPRPSIASNRIGGLTKYLPQFGWESVVLTPHVENLNWAPYAKVIETEYVSSIDKVKNIFGLKSGTGFQQQIGISKPGNKKGINSLVNIAREIIAYPDEVRTWVPTAIEEGIRIIKSENIEAIISSSPPVTVNLIASELSKLTNIPWIGDFRDLWTQNPYYPYSNTRKIIEKGLEVKTLKNAAALVTVSEPGVKEFKKLHQNKDIYCITNGFDPEEINVSNKLTKKFTITHTGQLYDEKRDPSILLEVISELINNGEIDSNNIQLRFYGPVSDKLKENIDRLNLSKVAIQFGVVNRKESIENQRESTVLLLLTWDDPRDEGTYTGKVFEYLSAKRPILAIGGTGGVVKDLLDTTQTGIQCSNKEVLMKLLVEWYQEYKEKGQVTYSGIWNEVEKYSHVHMAKKFAEVMDEVTYK